MDFNPVAEAVSRPAVHVQFIREATIVIDPKARQAVVRAVQDKPGVQAEDN
jgi:hypothetical protein